MLLVLAFQEGARSHAAIVTYDIDVSLSGLALSATFLGQPVIPQVAGSLFDFWEGTITGDLTNGTLTFSGGSSVVAIANPAAPFLPLGPGMDNYSGQVPAFGAVAAYRDLAFGFTSGSVTHGVAPMGTSTVTMLSGRSDYFLAPATTGNSMLAGDAWPNQSTTLVSIQELAGVETLRLPVRFTFTSGSGPTQTFDGTLIATRPVPEPATGVLLFAGLAFLAQRRRRLPVEPHRC